MMNWVLVVVLLIGNGVAPATMPKTYPTKEACMEDAQRWVELMASLPNETDTQWSGRRGTEVICFEQRGTN